MTCVTGITNKIWKAGDTIETVINYLDSDKNPIDLTGSTAQMQLRRKSTQSDPANLSMDGIIELSTGKITFIASSSETRALLANSGTRRYVYDIQVQLDPNNIKTLVSGEITVKIDVTR